MAVLGKFQGWCRDNNDPLMLGRIRAEVPFPLGTAWSVWALPCLPPGHFEVPKEGDGVWVEFQDGDPNRPIWVGIWYKGNGADPVNPTTAPMQHVHDALTDFGGAVVDPDKVDGERDPVTLAEHRGEGEAYGHNHTDKFYTPHRRVWQSETGHHLELNDHPGKQGYLRLYERYGRLIEFIASGITRLRSRVTPAAEGTWKDLNGTAVEGAHTLTLADLTNESGQFIELRDMTGAMLRMLSTPGEEAITLADFWGQHLLIKSVKGAEQIQLLDKAGQKITLDVATGTVQVDDKDGNFILMAAGKVVVSVKDGSKVHLGGEAGQQLATKTFVQAQYNTHMHVSGAPGSPTSPPMSPAPMMPGSDITKKTYSE